MSAECNDASRAHLIRDDEVVDLIKEELQSFDWLEHEHNSHAVDPQTASLTGVGSVVERAERVERGQQGISTEQVQSVVARFAERLTRRVIARTTIAEPDLALRRERAAKLRLQMTRANAQSQYIKDGLENGLLFSSKGVAEMLGSFDNNPRQFLNPKRRALELLAVRHGNTNYYPEFQFVEDENGTFKPLPELPQILAPLQAAGFNEWDMVFWLEAPSWELEGRSISEIFSEPGGPERAIQLAEALHGQDAN